MIAVMAVTDGSSDSLFASWRVVSRSPPFFLLGCLWQGKPSRVYQWLMWT
jgi:hypothetical protein